ncbi:hypothetical protein MRX96_020256 [Rhipicephalus microplus]
MRERHWSPEQLPLATAHILLGPAHARLPLSTFLRRQAGHRSAERICQSWAARFGRGFLPVITDRPRCKRKYLTLHQFGSHKHKSPNVKKKALTASSAASAARRVADTLPFAPCSSVDDFLDPRPRSLLDVFSDLQPCSSLNDFSNSQPCSLLDDFSGPRPRFLLTASRTHGRNRRPMISRTHSCAHRLTTSRTLRGCAHRT